jgi:hypothetical protein
VLPAGVFLGTENFFYTAQRLGMRVGPTAANMSVGNNATARGVIGAPVASHGRSALQHGVGQSHDVNRRGLRSAEQSTATAGAKPTATSSQKPSGMATLKELEAAGTAFCSLPWQQLKQEFIVSQGVPQVYHLVHLLLRA